MDRKFNLILKFYEGDSADADLGLSAKRSLAFQCSGDRTIQQLAAGIIAHYKKATTCELRIRELRDGNGSSLSSEALVEDCFTLRADAKGNVELYTVQVIREAASKRELERLKRDGTVILGGSLDLRHINEVDAASYEAEAQQERLQVQEQEPQKKRRREESVSHENDSAVSSIESSTQVSPKRRRLNSQTSQPSVQVTLSQPRQYKKYVLPKSESIASQTSTSVTAVNTGVKKTKAKPKSTIPGPISAEDLYKLTLGMNASQMRIAPRGNPRSSATRSPAPPKSSKPAAKVIEVPVASSDDSNSSASDDGSEIPAVAPRNDQSHSPARAVSSSDAYDDEEEEDDDGDGIGGDGGGGGNSDSDSNSDVGKDEEGDVDGQDVREKGDSDGDSDADSDADSDGDDEDDDGEEQEEAQEDQEHADEQGENLSETSEQTAVETKPVYKLVGPAKEPIGVESESSSQDEESASELCAPADKQFDLLTDNQSSDESGDLPMLPESRLARKSSQATTVSTTPSTQDRLNTQLHSENSQAFPAISQEKPIQSSQFGTIPTPTPAATNPRGQSVVKRGGLGVGGTPARLGGRAVFTASRAKDSNTGSLTALLQNKRAEKASQAKSPPQIDPRKYFNTSAEADDDDDDDSEEGEDDESDDDESSSEDSDTGSSKQKRKQTKKKKKKSGRNKKWDPIISSAKGKRMIWDPVGSSANSKQSTIL